MSNDRIGYFNLAEEGNSAIVRVLHSTVDTIEAGDTHWVETAEGKKKCVKCTGAGCPICASGSPITSRVYIHLYDYTDNTEKVWNRTDKIIPQLKEIQDAWGNLSECVIKITRLTKDFPKYSITVQNAKMFEAVDTELVDQKVAYRFYSTRSNEELSEFLKTGVMPEHKSTYVPKDEYFKNKNNNQSTGNATYTPKTTTATNFNQQSSKTAPFKPDFVSATTKVVQSKPSNDDVFSDPFMVKPSRRV